MTKRGPNRSAPMFVILRATGPDRWVVVDEVARRPGLPARKARRAAILEATGGKAHDGQRYAAVIRSEWLVAQVWSEGPPD